MPSWTDMIDDCHNRVYPPSHPWGGDKSNKSKSTNKSSSGKKK